jgi:hypothetical protein
MTHHGSKQDQDVGQTAHVATSAAFCFAVLSPYKPRSD